MRRAKASPECAVIASRSAGEIDAQTCRLTNSEKLGAVIPPDTVVS
ncbi:hypothetical protein N4S61_16385 [Burkholderia pseudomallei]|nr:MULTISPECIES: hypothetical protein [Burkholderia]MCS6601304.1 hypothetical protein [Burkholderia pseudomallei]MCT7347597.1 hypothetical protein [Burkholderia pseudomallei]MCT7917137.1 hypothetical protein [Burkholderia pseudomallei]